MKLKNEDEGRDVDDLDELDPGRFELWGYTIYSIRMAIFSSTREEKMRRGKGVEGGGTKDSKSQTG